MTRTIPDEQILDAALDVVAQHGYAGATVRRIADAAGVNAVTLFRRFSSKTTLLTAAVAHAAETFDAAALTYTGDVEADLTRVVRFYTEVLRRRGRLIAVLLHEVPRQPELLEVLRTPREVAGRVAGVLERYQRDGVLTPEPPLRALAALVGPVAVGEALTLVTETGAVPPVDPEAQVARFLHGRGGGTWHRGDGPSGRVADEHADGPPLTATPAGPNTHDRE